MNECNCFTRGYEHNRTTLKKKHSATHCFCKRVLQLHVLLFFSGFHVSRWITSHGLALNCNVDLNWFEHIVPCGLKGKSVTSLSVETWKDVKVDNVIQPFIESFQEVFNCELKDDIELINEVHSRNASTYTHT